MVILRLKSELWDQPIFPNYLLSGGQELQHATIYDYSIPSNDQSDRTHSLQTWLHNNLDTTTLKHSRILSWFTVGQDSGTTMLLMFSLFTPSPTPGVSGTMKTVQLLVIVCVQSLQAVFITRWFISTSNFLMTFLSVDAQVESVQGLREDPSYLQTSDHPTILQSNQSTTLWRLTWDQRLNSISTVFFWNTVKIVNMTQSG